MSLTFLFILLLFVRTSSTKQCYHCVMCDDTAELRITVDEGDWCYKSIVMGIIFRGSPGQRCISNANYFCCMGHLFHCKFRYYKFI
ncbi:unnamed protein product [Adineta ricciae]|uniref:Secreted protein n=1 Tax=Adineta ricciae TaxID=249248 RepID=A0A814NFX0_ADIRI|nr:unnamed protein product [Adineta ricciae]